MILDWNGPDIVNDVEAAAMRATDETTALGAEQAQRAHPWDRETGQLERFTISEPAKKVRPGIVAGKFGSTKKSGFYGYFQELGTVHQRPYPYLRAAGDMVFRDYPDRLAREFQADTYESV